MAVFNVTTTDTGLSVTVALASLRLRKLTGTGATLSDSLRRRQISLVADTGATVTDSIIASHAKVVTITTDIGLTTFGDFIHLTHAVVKLSDQGLNVTDGIGLVFPADTGLTLADSLVAATVRPRSPTDTGLTFSEALARRVTHQIADAGASLLDSLAASSGGRNSRSLTVTGLTFTSSISLSVTRGPNTYILVDQALNLSDAITVTTSYGPPSDPCSIDFRRFLTDLQASTEYSDWCTANPGECATWTTYKNQILNGNRPAPPAMSTSFGDSLVDAGVIALDGMALCKKLTASFGYHMDASPLGVDFTNTSTPGLSGPIDSWTWYFGDGGTETFAWNPTHTYVAPGTYIVTLIIHSPDGTASTSRTVTVTDNTGPFVGFHIDAVVV